VPGLWAYGDGGAWHEDASISVTAVEPPGGACRRHAGVAKASPSIGEQVPEKAQKEADSPGEYIIVHNQTAVTNTLIPTPPIIAYLCIGQRVAVLEVMPYPEEQRIRGRIAKPPGWISLSSTEDGYCWASRQDDHEGMSDISTEDSGSSSCGAVTIGAECLEEASLPPAPEWNEKDLRANVHLASASSALSAVISKASIGSSAPQLKVVLECVRATGLDPKLLEPRQRRMARRLAAGCKWAVGPESYPQAFASLLWLCCCEQGPLFELAWEPPHLYLRSAAAPVSVDGRAVPLSAAWRLMPLAEIEVGGAEGRIAFRVLPLCDDAGEEAPASALDDSNSPSIWDLRQRHWSRDGPNALSNFETDSLRIIV